MNQITMRSEVHAKKQISKENTQVDHNVHSYSAMGKASSIVMTKCVCYGQQIKHQANEQNHLLPRYQYHSCNPVVSN
jgi:hypothetical protein